MQYSGACLTALSGPAGHAYMHPGSTTGDTVTAILTFDCLQRLQVPCGPVLSLSLIVWVVCITRNLIQVASLCGLLFYEL